MKKELGTASSKQKSDGSQNCKTTESQQWVCLFCGDDNLQFHEVCARWIPKELMDEHKCMHLDICFRHLAIIAKKVITFCNGSSQVMKPGFTTVKQKPSRRTCNGSICISCCKEIRDITINRPFDVDYLRGFSRAYS
jgi:hypothetical protein